MNRRKLLGGIAYVAALSGFHSTNASAQPTKPFVGFLTGRTGFGPTSLDTSFAEGLRELGWQDGINLQYEWVGVAPEMLRSAAEELISRGVTLLVASGRPATTAAQQATATIPIVSITTDPTRDIANFARPERNVTGRSLLGEELGGKRLELLKEALPGMKKVAILFSSDNPSGEVNLRLSEAAAQGLGLEVVPSPVRTGGFADAIRFASEQHVDAALVLSQGQTVNPDASFDDLLREYRLPTMFTSKAFVVGGGLMSYGPNVNEVYRAAAKQVDRILRGAKPGDLPVEAPTVFELAINLRTAKATGLNLPPAFLSRADEVIE